MRPCASVWMYVCLCACGPACRSVGLPVSLSNCRSVWLSACLYNCVSVCWSVAPSVGRSPRRSVCLRLSVGLYVCQRACLSVCRYVCLSVELSGCLPACMPILLCVCLLVCRPVGLSVCRSVGRGPSACRSSPLAPRSKNASNHCLRARLSACRPVARTESLGLPLGWHPPRARDNRPPSTFNNSGGGGLHWDPDRLSCR